MSIPEAADLERIAREGLEWMDFSPAYLKKALPRAAKDALFLSRLEHTLRRLHSSHVLYCADARDMSALPDESVRANSVGQGDLSRCCHSLGWSWLQSLVTGI